MFYPNSWFSPKCDLAFLKSSPYQMIVKLTVLRFSFAQ